jgi:hypothetical protein
MKLGAYLDFDTCPLILQHLVTPNKYLITSSQNVSKPIISMVYFGYYRKNNSFVDRILHFFTNFKLTLFYLKYQLQT